MSWIWTVASVLLFYWFLQQLLGMNKNRNRPPGPVGLPIIGHFYLIGKKPHKDIQKLSQRYGHIMYLRFGFIPVIVVSSPLGAELILKTHDLIFAGRPRHQASRHISYDQRNLVFAPYGSYWRNMRKLCTLQLLSSFKINQFEPMRRVELEYLIDTLKESAEKHEIVDISARVSALTWDMTCLMIFGRKYGDRELGGEKGFKAVINETLQLAVKHNLADYFPILENLDLQGLTKQMKELSKTFDEFLDRIIEDHVQNKEGKETLDFVDTMMAILESGEADFEFDSRHVKAVLLDMLIAGVDTSAASIEWAMTELIRHPDVMQKLKKELEQAVGMDTLVQESQLDKLEYLDLVIKEALRLHPVIPILVHESIEDCTIEQFFIPKRTRIIVNIYAIMNDHKVWTAPEKFLPERFVGRNVDLHGRDFRLLPFGSGRRGCPGLNLGLTVVKLVVAQLVHCFDWELPDGDLDMTEHFGMVVGRENHLTAIPSYRLSGDCVYRKLYPYC